jgi:hypothetical protein
MKSASATNCEDYMAIVKAEMPFPNDYNDAQSFALAYQSWSLLRKYSSFPINIDRRAVALDGFLKSEKSCGQINREVDALPYVSGVPLERQSQSVIEIARRYIERALGKFDWNEHHSACEFSGGASTRCKKKQGNAYFKLSGKPHVTLNCRDLAITTIWHNDLWRQHCQDLYGRESDPYSWVQVVPGSRFDTVPKDSDKDRPICIEPELNMFFQKGVGKMLRGRLKRVGINLNSQVRNQVLALLGSITDLLATIDLSSASDSVSLRVCEMLLPRDWYEAMLMMRSAYVEIDGKMVRLQKISSMGNGFTFELESLLFWALSKASLTAHAIESDHLAVYGDDIIIDGRAANTLIRTLQNLGFETNRNKTFVSGPFRESCGKHYFLGSDVSPFRIKDPIETWADSYHLANALREWTWADPQTIESIVSDILKPIPPRQRCYVPMSFGSKSGLRVVSPPKRRKWCNELMSWVYGFHYLREETNDHDMSGPVAYLSGMLQKEQAVASVMNDSIDNGRKIPFNTLRKYDGYKANDSVGYGQLSRVDEGNWVRRYASVSSWCDTLAA